MSDTTTASLRRHDYWTPRVSLTVLGERAPMSILDHSDVHDAAEELDRCIALGADHASIQIAGSPANIRRCLARLADTGDQA